MVMQKDDFVFKNFTSKYLEWKSLVISLPIKRFIKKIPISVHVHADGYMEV